MNERFVSITKKLSFRPSISSKGSNSIFFFHDHISIKRMKEIYPKIVPNSLSLNQLLKMI